MGKSNTIFAFILFFCFCSSSLKSQVVKKNNFVSDYSIGLNFGKWSNDEVEFGIHSFVNHSIYNKGKFEMKMGLFFNIDYLPTSLFYNRNSGKVNGVDLRVQLPQIAIGCDYNIFSKLKISPQFLYGLSYAIQNGRYVNTAINLSPQNVSTFNSKFTANANLRVKYILTKKTGISADFFYPLTKKLTPQLIGISIDKYLH